jgi:hypothetical protein
MVKLYLDEEWMKVRPIVPSSNYRKESDLKSKHGNITMNHYKHAKEHPFLVETIKVSIFIPSEISNQNLPMQMLALSLCSQYQ